VKSQFDDATEAMMEINVGLTLTLASIAEFLIEEGVINRANLVSSLQRRAAAWDKKGSEGQSWPLQTVLAALGKSEPKLVKH
jgi:hypothetical protein